MGLDMNLMRKKEGQPALNVKYWRKFNALHRWFLELEEGSEDDGSTIEVTNGSLVELRGLIQYGIKNQSPTLTPMSGFFFGSTTIDEDYWADMAETLVFLNQLIDDDFENSSFYYFASW